MMAGWTIGDVRITPVFESLASLPCDMLLPGATAEAVRAIPWIGEPFVTAEAECVLCIQAFVVEAGGQHIVVDTCVGNDKPRAGMGNMLSTKFLERFASAGFTRETIDVVLCTHLHVDHVGWNTMLEDGRWVPTFPHARYLIGRAEFAHMQAQEEVDDRALLADSVQPLFEHRLVDLVDGDHRIGPEVRLVSTPGHTPGHVSVMIESGGQRAMISGDFLHNPVQLARPDWGAFVDHDRMRAEATRRAVLADLADNPALLIGTHFPAPTAGRVERDGDNYRFVA